MKNCEWRKKISLYVDGELEPAAERTVASHLQSCADCSATLLEQQELKKSVRVAGKRFTAPPDLYTSVRKQIAPKPKTSMFWQWSTAASSLMLVIVLGFTFYSRPRASNATVGELIDQHVTMLASDNPVDVISNDTHNVKPWYQGKLPFSFNLPELAKESPFSLLGGKLVYAQHSSGAEVVYKVRQHKISVFIFSANDVHGELNAGGQNFVVNGWQQNGLQFYLVTDAARENTDRLRALFEEANRS
ncbi:MAG TPA: zf-HC2 domain-containing protein [Candidatus Angelobacter sp.]